MLCESGAEFEESPPEGAACIHSPPSVEGLCSSPGGSVLSPQLTWSYPGWLLYQSWACRTSHGLCSHCDCFAFLAGQYPRAQRMPVSDCLSVQACLHLLWSPIPEGSCFSGPYFCLLPSVPGSPVQPFPQFKVSQRSVKSGSLGIQYAAPKTMTHLFIKLVGCTKTGC